SYGGILGGVLAGVDRRVKTFVLVGGVALYTQHVTENQAEVWVDWRKQFTREQLTRALDEPRAVDPDRYVANSHGRMLFQRGSFDFENVAGGENYYRAASSPRKCAGTTPTTRSRIWERPLDRMHWLEKELRLKPVRPLLERLWISPTRRSAPMKMR